MTWYYASGGQQMGPVDEATLDDLVRQGVVRDDTLVWRQGLPGWQAHGSARPRPAAPPPPPAVPPAPAAHVAVATAPSVSPAQSWSDVQAATPAAQAFPPAAAAQEMRFCSNCGRPTPVSQLTTVSGASVCTVCLPLLAGAAPAAPSPSAYQPAPAGYAGGGYQGAPTYPAPGAYAPAPAYPQGVMPGQIQYAGFWIRFLARIIDWIILGIAGAIVRLPLALVMGGIGLGLSRAQDPAAALAALPALFGAIGLSFLINIVLGFVYEVYFLSTRAATPGKMALGLKVIRADGGPITMNVAVGRYFAYVLSGFTFFIGFIIAGFDDEKRALHDRICNTRVIKA